MAIEHEYLDKLRSEVDIAQSRVDDFIYLLGKFPDLRVVNGVLVASDLGRANWCNKNETGRYSFWHKTDRYYHGNVFLGEAVDGRDLRSMLFDIVASNGCVGGSEVACDVWANEMYEILVKIKTGHGIDLDP